MRTILAVRFLGCWRKALLTGGRLAATAGGLISLAVGGSAVAYFQAATHRSVWVVIGAGVVVALVMAAYRMWDEADRRAAALQARFDQTPVAPDHAAQITGQLTAAQQAIHNHRRLEEFGVQLDEVVRAHLPTLIAPLAADPNSNDPAGQHQINSNLSLSNPTTRRASLAGAAREGDAVQTAASACNAEPGPQIQPDRRVGVDERPTRDVERVRPPAPLRLDDTSERATKRASGGIRTHVTPHVEV